jgi:hypothetical protein
MSPVGYAQITRNVFDPATLTPVPCRAVPRTFAHAQTMVILARVESFRF